MPAPRTILTLLLVPGLLAAAAHATSQTPRVEARYAARVERLTGATAAARTMAPRPDAGLLVLDLEALESTAAAVDLVQSWQRRQPSPRQAECWLKGAAPAVAMKAAARLLDGPSPACRQVHVLAR